ncbi:MAG: metal ABC transporter ATP-binding protein [Coriobacteriales bacterium]|jgi:zinc transport system ATP-binding protein|nr:metal ABC transporter ATP-binding protein [Coriobacteriales bacterium]
MALITCKKAAFCYEGTCVVSGLDFCVGFGDYLCVVGENGSGKSTLIKGILGLKHPSDGRIDFGEGLTRQDIGYLPQQNSIQKSFPASVQEVVLLGRLAKHGLRPFYTRRDRQAASQVMEQLGISGLARAGFGELSGGQQQRVLLARALCAAPDGLKVLILDEPMNGLDPVIKQELYQLIQHINTQQNIAIIMVTHDVQNAVRYASHLLLLDRRQEFYGTAHAFQHSTLGQDLLRDSCGNHCAVCGLTVGGR